MMIFVRIQRSISSDESEMIMALVAGAAKGIYLSDCIRFSGRPARTARSKLRPGPTVQLAKKRQARDSNADASDTNTRE